MSLERLRKLAEINLCSDCYKEYLMSIEPTIKKFLEYPLSEWRVVESNAKILTMKTYGAFTGRPTSFKIDMKNLPKELRNEFDIERYKKIKKWRFQRNIDYLHKKGILQDSAYKFLCKANKARNKIHPPFEEYSEQDFSMFHNALNVISQINLAINVFDQSKEISENLKSSAEELAKQLLNE